MQSQTTLDFQPEPSAPQLSPLAKNCPVCGNLTSKRAAYCPHCGDPITAQRSDTSWFTYLGAFLIIAALLVMYASSVSPSPASPAAFIAAASTLGTGVFCVGIGGIITLLRRL